MDDRPTTNGTPSVPTTQGDRSSGKRLSHQAATTPSGYHTSLARTTVVICPLRIAGSKLRWTVTARRSACDELGCARGSLERKQIPGRETDKHRQSRDNSVVPFPTTT
jgi:hypothetical protein